MSKVGEITAFVEGQPVTIDAGDGVKFQLGEGDERVTVGIEYGYLRIHSHGWGKSLAAIGYSSNVLKLAVIDR